MLFRRFLALLLVVPFATGITASDAGAVYIPGASYSGPSSLGGNVSFTVTADGHGVTGFAYDYLPIGCGTWLSEGPRYETVAVVNDSFSYTGEDEVAYTRTFTGPQTATGTLTWNGPYRPGQHPVLTWAAPTTVTVVGVADTAGEVDASANATSAAQEANVDDNTATEQTTVQPLCVVPRVVGKTLAAAEAAIAGGHCRTGAIAHAYSKKTKKG